MTSITNNVARTSLVALFAFTMISLSFGFVAQAHATDLPSGGDDSGDWVTDSATPYYDYSSAPSDSGDWVTDSATPYYDYSTPSSYYSGSTGYSTPSYFTGSGSFGGSYGFSNPGNGFGGSSSTYAPTTVTDTSSVYAPTQTNTCTGGNTCNTTISTPTTVTIDNDQPVSSQPQPVVYQQPTCTTCNCYGPCNTIVPTQPIVPVYPTQAPYVSLTAVPYTGLDLGPVGTVLYWSFLVLWCLAAAYLIVVKRVQNKIVAMLNHFLFGVSHPAPRATAHSAHVAYASHAPVVHEVQSEDTVDPFIASQIHRAK